MLFLGQRMSIQKWKPVPCLSARRLQTRRPETTAGPAHPPFAVLCCGCQQTARSVPAAATSLVLNFQKGEQKGKKLPLCHLDCLLGAHRFPCATVHWTAYFVQRWTTLVLLTVELLRCLSSFLPHARWKLIKNCQRYGRWKEPAVGFGLSCVLSIIYNKSWALIT